ncbi:cation:H+ antiporter [Lentibacillus persicus]|uniref:Cation:H+ antiporter n=1 Tax=Lentibacillus persicus TaxID=640948 RepID=A0A1I1YE55_9BACI|nr:sodium:calcium antiporter [Lentibacillus persicus]SFE17895.1 cation:H+ antiporter [Lentibacillus persicus]
MLLFYSISFVAAAVVSVFIAIKLASYADIISKETKAGGLVVGTALLATGTSLPELTSTISAAVINSPDIAVGNGLGSITFNFFVLFLFDMYFRRKRLFLNVSDNHILTGLLGMLLCVIAAFSLYVDADWHVMKFSVTSMLMIAVYIGGLSLISAKHQQDHQEQQYTAEDNTERHSIRKVIIKFMLLVIVIFISGSALSVTGDLIAQNSAISASAVGSLLIAATSSLPDAVSVWVALRAANINLAIGTILGSNIFNIFVVPVADAFYRGGSIWAEASNQHIATAAAGFILTSLVLLIIKRDDTRNTFTYMIPSITIVVGYLFFSVFYVLSA